MIEIRCNECKNFTRHSCKKYGSDAKESVTRSANDGFKNSKRKRIRLLRAKKLNSFTKKGGLKI